MSLLGNVGKNINTNFNDLALKLRRNHKILLIFELF